MVHINADPYDLKSPAACGSYGEGEQVISLRVAANILETGQAKLSKITVDDLCAECLDEVAHLAFELLRSDRE